MKIKEIPDTYGLVDLLLDNPRLAYAAYLTKGKFRVATAAFMNVYTDPIWFEHFFKDDVDTDHPFFKEYVRTSPVKAFEMLMEITKDDIRLDEIQDFVKIFKKFSFFQKLDKSKFLAAMTDLIVDDEERIEIKEIIDLYLYLYEASSKKVRRLSIEKIWSQSIFFPEFEKIIDIVRTFEQVPQQYSLFTQ